MAGDIAFEEYVSDVATLVELPPDVVLALAEVGWATSFMNKRGRMDRVVAFVEARYPEGLQGGGRVYDPVELLVGLAHLRRGKYPDAAENQDPSSLA